MTDILVLTKEKVALQMQLQCIAVMNVSGRSMKELVELETQKIEAIKRLNEVNAEIDKYTGTTHER